MKRELIRCKHCGELTARRKYCDECAPIVDKEKNRIRQERYRKRHGNSRVVQWRKDHPDEARLISRRWNHTHPDKVKAMLKDWRSKHPEKVRLQNKRAHKKLKHRKMKREYEVGKRKPSPIIGDTRSFCKTCDREMPYSGKGRPREYCDGCFPQFKALRNFVRQESFKKKNPNHFKEWYRDTKEHVVASTCSVCGELIMFKGRGRIPILCEYCGIRRDVNGKRRRTMMHRIPSDTMEFIKAERERLGLNRNKKWNKREINNLYAFYEKQYPTPIGVPDD